MIQLSKWTMKEVSLFRIPWLHICATNYVSVELKSEFGLKLRPSWIQTFLFIGSSPSYMLVPHETDPGTQSMPTRVQTITLRNIPSTLFKGSILIPMTYESKSLILCTMPQAAIFFSVPLFGLRIFLLISIFHFENLSKFIIFSNEDVRRIKPQTNNHKSNYRTTRPARDELPGLRF